MLGTTSHSLNLIPFVSSKTYPRRHVQPFRPVTGLVRASTPTKHAQETQDEQRNISTLLESPTSTSYSAEGCEEKSQPPLLHRLRDSVLKAAAVGALCLAMVSLETKSTIDPPHLLGSKAWLRMFRLPNSNV